MCIVIKGNYNKLNNTFHYEMRVNVKIVVIVLLIANIQRYSGLVIPKCHWAAFICICRWTKIYNRMSKMLLKL